MNMITKISEVKNRHIRIIKEDDTKILNIIFNSQFIFKELKVKNLQELNAIKSNLEEGLLDSLINERKYIAMAITIK